ncbi:hypothetical protein [Mechercharimyces sp. CAU 1602]|uniref:hypothetical protein n=1 Tax=Mechercharimyces sp. CAU 1602 TaxID=2973933 RepID=UPI0021636BA6|nr:hypothetical protein [Mechercharimyces sp. CAU 1602]MCS1352841.1 hypothetical protein [Mechercharimyces sp. CAU 1602]
MKSWWRKYWHVLQSRKGASTLEYIIILAAGVALAGLLFIAIQEQETPLKNLIMSALNGEVDTKQQAAPPTIEKASAEEEKKSSSPTPANAKKEHKDKSWADKAEEIPGLGWVVKKSRPFVEDHIEPFYDDYIDPWAGDPLEFAWDFVDPVPKIYEMTEGNEWDTGDHLGNYDRYAEPVLEYLVAKKLGKAGNLFSKLDNKLFDGFLTKKYDDYIADPLTKKRDDFVDWVCDDSSSGKTGARFIGQAYADSKSNNTSTSCSLTSQILGGTPRKSPSEYSNDQTRKHVHEGETVEAPQSAYNRKWSGDGLHNWKNMKERVRKDGYEFEEILLDSETGVRKVKVKLIGSDPQVKAKYEKIKNALEELQDPDLSKSRRKKLEKQVPPDMKNKKPEDIDPEAEARTSKVETKTVYPENYTEQEIDELGGQALEEFMKNNGNLPYSVNRKGKVDPVLFKSTVKGPDGKDIEVEGYVVPKPDGTVDYMDTHYPKFDNNSNVVKEK